VTDRTPSASSSTITASRSRPASRGGRRCRRRRC
jgi:hypothetical protein